MVLAVMQASAPIPRQASNGDAKTSSKVQKESADKQPQGAPIAPPLKQSATPSRQQSGGNQSSDNATESVTISKAVAVSVVSGWREDANLILTTLLVFMGGGGVFAALRTLNAIQKQSRAAEDTIELYKNKERARIGVTFRPLKLNDRAFPKSSTRIIKYTVSILGPTAAYILDSNLRVEKVIKGQEKERHDDSFSFMFPIPDLPNLIAPNSPLLEREALLIFEDNNEGAELESIRRRDMIIIAVGSVRYTDVFGASWKVSFKYRWEPPFGIPGLDSFNDEMTGRWIQCGITGENEENQEPN